MHRTAWHLAILFALVVLGGAETGRASSAEDESVSDGKSRFFSPPPGAQAEDRGFDCTSAEIEIVIDFDSQTIQSRVIHRFRPTRTIDLLRLDLTDSLSVTSVRRGAVDLPFTHEGRSLEISLIPPLTPLMHGEVEIAYEGHPPRDGLLGFSFHDRDGTPGAFTVSEPASASGWWPCKDVPDDKLTARITLDVPDTLYAGSNGRLVSDESADGRRRMVWQEDWPIAPYLVGLACTKYEPYEETHIGKDGRALPLLFLPYPEHREMAGISWGRTSDILTAFEDRFGPYPFAGEKYGMAEFFWGGAMENQTLTLYGEYLVDGTDANDWEVAHELSHSWWGNSVTLGSWEQMWLNEGFARYSEALWFESRDGIDGYREWMRGMWRPDFPGALVPPDYIFNSTVYLKGAWVLHMLRGILGQEMFFTALRAYGEEFAHSNATTEDLIASFESSTGRGLRWFFDPWVYGTGRPDYSLSWSSTPVAGGLDRSLPAELDLTIAQLQPEPPFRMPIELEIRDGIGSYRVTVLDSLRQQSLRLPVRLQPLAVSLDPDDWILKGSVEGSSALDPSAASSLPGPVYPSPGLPPFRIPIWSGRTTAIEILGITGRRVAELPVGGETEVAWDGRDAQGRDLPSGVYWVRLAGAPTAAPRRIVLLR